jgi:CheY-like chemotaxis protein
LSNAIRPGKVGLLQAVDLNGQIRETIQFSRPRWMDETQAKGISIRVESELGDVPDVRGNIGELSEVVLNLLLNAIDAMPEGGTMTISTKLSDEDGFVALTVSGTGMDEETRRRVFEPFFTTKADVGSGFGLSTAYGSVMRSGGTIEVESEVGRGTTFTVRLPIFEDVKEDAETVEDRSGRSGKILLGEDDEMTCEVLQRILTPKHTVEVARDGMDALQTFTPGRFDVALIDLGIPTVPGDKVAANMREQDPALVTALITGWILEEGDDRLSSFDLHLQKPILGPDLVDIVAEAIVLHDSRV